ncbi:NHL repeat-containing protein [Solimonas aquatica]|uniref:NHL repeat-containing protein n=1 Tax=Solimonas aquatica TaxID=489703 RepID=A0A1H9DHX6_9GAMM|nr:NHL repeat-containing protein [Solimonas aquatica]SEQ13112.1 NHL repeat-containing protein [Solimonas aquatica]
MNQALKVHLTPALSRAPEPAGRAALDPQGPQVCIGAREDACGLAVPVRPEPGTLFGPRGACMAGGSLWVCDTGHHRLLGWAQPPQQDHAPADWLIGQPDFYSEGRNGKAAPSATSFNVPTGISACGEGLAVADAWNHRVLIWHRVPRASHTPADLVLGQRDFLEAQGNRGGETAADTLFWPYGVHWDGARLWVADSGNRRVLMWQGLPQQNGQAADLVLGQSGFTQRDENGGGDPSAASMRWPHAVVIWGEALCVADAGNNRIMVWSQLPRRHQQPCDILLGQQQAHLVDHNQSLYWPSAETLNMPYGVAAAGDWLLAADTANSRIIAWHRGDLHSGAPARALSGQLQFNAKGDNRWQMPVRDSLCWPYGLSVQEGRVVVADSGNNRVLLWPLAQELLP